MLVTYRLEFVKCGKPGCKSDRHGPYWYAYWKDKGKLRKLYIGKKLPDGVKQTESYRQACNRRRREFKVEQERIRAAAEREERTRRNKKRRRK